MKFNFQLDLENADWETRYPTAGLPSQPFQALIPAEIPPILTARLQLIHMKTEHLDGINAIQHHPSNQKYQPPAHLRPSKELSLEEQTRQWMASKTFTTPPLAKDKHFYFVVTQREDPSEKIIGTLGLNTVDPLPYIGYAIHPDHWGKGYASEGVGGVIDAWWALPRISSNADIAQNDNGDGRSSNGEEARELILALVNKENIASLRVLDKNGFGVYHEHLYGDDATVCFLAAKKPDTRAD